MANRDRSVKCQDEIASSPQRTWNNEENCSQESADIAQDPFFALTLLLAGLYRPRNFEREHKRTTGWSACSWVKFGSRVQGGRSS